MESEKKEEKKYICLICRKEVNDVVYPTRACIDCYAEVIKLSRKVNP